MIPKQTWKQDSITIIIMENVLNIMEDAFSIN